MILHALEAMLALSLAFVWAQPLAARHQSQHLTRLQGNMPLGIEDLKGEALPQSAIWLETLDLNLCEQEWGAAQSTRSVDGNPLSIGGIRFQHGVGSHANSEYVIDLKQSALAFHAAVGVDDEVGDLGSVAFAVWVDGQEVARTEVMRGGNKPQVISVDLTDAREMTLIVEDGGDHIHYDHADWGGALLVLRPDAEERPVAQTLPEEPMPIIAMGFDPQPAIHAPRITGATPGRPFLFRIPATGSRPLRFEAHGLPAELGLDEETGIITGSLSEAGEWQVRLTARNDEGEATSTLTIVGGDHKLALTPPMGWNSWNVWGTAVDDAKVRAAADWMVKSGLADAGFQYINIDDAWEGERDDAGFLHTNDKFPDMKALADYVHSKGLKLGIYSSPGPLTCAGYEGSYKHELQDAQAWADWGIDLVKYDWCSYRNIARDMSEAELRKPYEVMRKALDQVDRDIVYSLCQYGMGEVSNWGDAVGGDYWRTTGDIVDTWSSMSGIGFSQAPLAEFAGPGHWNDPDMLVIGFVGWGATQHPTRLTPNEQITHMTLWSMLASPLLIGCDMSRMDPFTVAVLSNPEVLGVNQDHLGKQARPIRAENRLEVWARPLHDGAQAVALFNRGRIPAVVTVTWDELNLDGPQAVRNLWLRADEGIVKKAYSTELPRHGAVMLKVTPVSAHD